MKISNVADEASYLYKNMMEGKKAECPSIKLFNNPGWIDQQLDPETVTPVFHVDHKEYLEEEQKLFFHYEQHINNVSHIIFSNNHLLCKYYNRIFSEDNIYYSQGRRHCRTCRAEYHKKKETTNE